MDANQLTDTDTLNKYSALDGESLAILVDDMAREMKFYAVFYIIYGALISLSIFGAVLGIPMIIYNIKLKDAATQYREFAQTQDFVQLQRAFKNQKKFFFFNKILIIIMLVIFLFYILAIIMFGLSLFMSTPEGFLQA